MAADSSMGFHQGITASMYNHHMLSFQSNSSSELGSGSPAAGDMVMAPRSMNGGSSSSAGLFLSPNNGGVLGNASVVGPSSSSSAADVYRSTVPPKYKFVTGSPSDWSEQELNILKEGLVRYAREPNIMKYIKIAAMLPKRTIRDVALRCWWSTGKDRRKKPDGFFTGKKIRDMKPIQDKMVASSSMANFHLAPANTVTPFSISMQHTNQQCQVPKEAAPVVDSATQHLLEENNHLLNLIAANIETLKTGQNMDLFFQTNNNIQTILSRMSETPGIMSQMPQLPEQVNEDHLSSLIQLDRLVLSFGVTHTSHMKQEPRS
uniref:Myb-like domain-containing protein n=1 Tax=Leersia perrieri TaxID=77586 RepID=A0A0D9WB13_9ORYZ